MTKKTTTKNRRRPNGQPKRPRAARRRPVVGCIKVEGVEAEGRTVNEATEKALQELGLRREQVNVEVLSEGRPRLLGFRGEPARVRVTPLPPPQALTPRPGREASEPEDEDDDEEYEDEEEGDEDDDEEYEDDDEDE